MDKKDLIKIQKEKREVKINLKNGFFYRGQILSVGETSIIFLDKFNNEIPMDLDSIAYVLPVSKIGGKEYGN